MYRGDTLVAVVAGGEDAEHPRLEQLCRGFLAQGFGSPFSSLKGERGPPFQKVIHWIGSLWALQCSCAG